MKNNKRIMFTAISPNHDMYIHTVIQSFVYTFNLNRSEILKCLNKKQLFHNNWQFKYINEYEYEFDKKFHISYKMYGEYLETLIRNELININVDALYGPPRGGFPIVTHLSHYLNIDKIIINELDIGLYKNVLVCDDVADSGETLSKIITKFPETSILTTSLFVKPRSCVIPDFYLATVADDIWIRFPWEKQTDKADKDYMMSSF